MDLRYDGGDGFCQEDEQMIHKSGKLPQSFFPEPPRGNWYESHDGATTTTTAAASAAPKFELMTNVAGESSNLTLGNSSMIQKEHMFDKVVTPSDVGKLNRLVIPKQHAEKFFPLDSSSNDKGLLLNFEDRTGKPWRFRYSYWNSSQSYVMTKGWSRFVKEKKLDAGDIVSFQRGVGDLAKDRLYIDWRRRTQDPTLSYNPNFAFHRSVPWSPMFYRPATANISPASYLAPQHHNNINFHQNQIRSNYHYVNNSVNPSFIYLRSSTGVESQGISQREDVMDPMVFDSVPVVQGKAAGKKLRLFGVNMECGVSSSELDESIDEATMESQHESSSTIPFTLQSRLYNGTPLQTDFFNKGKSPSKSFDLDRSI